MEKKLKLKTIPLEISIVIKGLSKNSSSSSSVDDSLMREGKRYEQEILEEIRERALTMSLFLILGRNRSFQYNRR